MNYNAIIIGSGGLTPPGRFAKSFLKAWHLKVCFAKALRAHRESQLLQINN